MSNISKIARNTKAVIEKRGWFQGWYYDQTDKEQGSVCFLGAHNIACNRAVDDDTEDLAYSDFIEACKDYLGISMYMHDWNDADDRTKDEVLDMLENVAIKYDDDAYTSGANNDTV